MSLHVALSGWLLGTPSGANRRLEELLRHLAPQLAPDERITVLHRTEVPPFAALRRIEWRQVPIAAGPTLRRARDEMRHLPRLLRELGAHVLDHGFLPVPRVPIPVVLTIHDLRGPAGLTPWPRWLARRALRAAAARAAALVVPSRFTADELIAIAPVATPTVIPNGVDVPPAAPPPDAVPGYLLHVGHIEPRKNLDVVLRALARLPCEERPGLRLVGRDAGALPSLRERAAELGVSAQLTALGTLPDDAVAAQYRGARAVVVPSRYEGFGLPALEGLAHGRPVLVAAAGALPEVVGAAGTVLPPDDDAAWAAAIAATDADHRADARRARAQQFPWADAAERLLQRWRDVAAANR